jgi:glycosyltransferase involved in cell wall biosynthesis
LTAYFSGIQINMRILYFHQYFKTLEGTGGTRSYEMAKHFISQGHQVTMVYIVTEEKHSTLSNPYHNGVRRGSFDGIDLIEFDLNYSNKLNLFQRAKVFLAYSYRSIKLVFKEEYDILFATSTPLTAGIPGIVMKIAGKKKPFLFEVRDLWPEAPREMGVVKNRFVLWLLSILEYLSYSKADACVGLSPGMVEGIRRRLNKEKPVYLIPNSCDLELFKPGKEDKSLIPGVEGDPLVAVFTGAHGYANGLENALDGAAELLKTAYAEKIKLVFVGDGIKKAELVARKEKEGLDNCIFVDPVPKKDLIRILKASDVGLMLFANVRAFYYGTSPNKFFDYISSGLPVLNNYPGWVADMINQNECGLAIAPDSPRLFADALVYFYQNKKLLPEMGRNSRRLAEADFDRKKLAAQLLNALETTYKSYYTKG